MNHVINSIKSEFTQLSTIFLLIACVLYYIVEPITLFNVYYYIKNGGVVNLNTKYQVDLPFAHWAYFGEGKYAYIYIGRRINEQNLTAEVYKNAEQINLKNVFAHCENIIKKEQCLNKINRLIG